MHFLMLFQITLIIEPLATLLNVADKRLIPCVLAHVSNHITFLAKGLIAIRADKFFLLLVMAAKMPLK